MEVPIDELPSIPAKHRDYGRRKEVRLQVHSENRKIQRIRYVHEGLYTGVQCSVRLYYKVGTYAELGNIGAVRSFTASKARSTGATTGREIEIGVSIPTERRIDQGWEGNSRTY